MNRLFVIDKPKNISSNFYLKRIKWKYKVKKAGFSGTLDPFANGCLITAFGQYTKLFRFLKKTPKIYRATLWLGADSETLDIEKITTTYHNWRKSENYEDEKGFCKSATIEEIQKHSHVLTPGRYVGIPDEEDDGIPFEDKMAELTATLKQQMDKEADLNQEITTQLSKIGFGL